MAESRERFGRQERMKISPPSRLSLWELAWHEAAPLLRLFDLLEPRFWKDLRRSRIFDCFTFFNELQLLEVRLEELWDVVDRFVLVEGTKTHSNRDKPLYFEENKSKFEKYKKKIIHVVIEDMPPLGSEPGARWRLENHQRNGILKGLAECGDSDVVLVSDIDEIPDPRKFGQMLFLLAAGARSVSFRQKFYFYYLNGLKKEQWTGSVGTYYKTLIRKFETPQQVRESRGLYPSALIEAGGWHFSYLGGAESVAHKIHSLAHAEFDTPEYTNPRTIAEKMRSGEDLFGKSAPLTYVPIDQTFPKTIVKDPRRFQELLHQVSQ